MAHDPRNRMITTPSFPVRRSGHRGALVRLGPAWRDRCSITRYPAPVAQLLGEMSATTLLLGDKLKQPGRLTIQLRGSGADRAAWSSTATQNYRSAAWPSVPSASRRLRPAAARRRAAATGRWTWRRCASPTKASFRLTAKASPRSSSTTSASRSRCPRACLLAASPTAQPDSFCSELPTAEQRDPDGWTRIEALAATVKDARAALAARRRTPAPPLWRRNVRLFPARPVAHNCPENWEKVRSMLRALGPRRGLCGVAGAGRSRHQGRHLQSRIPLRRAGDRRTLRDSPSADTPPTLH
jgi:molecular chaperone Hsp33